MLHVLKANSFMFKLKDNKGTDKVVIKSVLPENSLLLILGEFKDYLPPLQLTAIVNPYPTQSSSYSTTHFSDVYSSQIVASLKSGLFCEDIQC